MKTYETKLTVPLNPSTGLVRLWFLRIGFVMAMLMASLAGAVYAHPEWRNHPVWLETAHRVLSWRVAMGLGGQAQLDHLVAQRNQLLVHASYSPAPTRRSLNGGQREVVKFLSKRYSVSSEAVEGIVRLAYQVGEEERVDPTLILAIVGIESSYNPYAASSVGAKGLMQVMPKIHQDRFNDIAEGQWSALTPALNMRVGAQVIHEYTRRTGSLETALKWYVGAAVSGNDGGYPAKVLALKAKIDGVYRQGRKQAGGRKPAGEPAPESVQPEVLVRAMQDF